MAKQKLIYLATPYSPVGAMPRDDADILKTNRSIFAAEIAARLIKQGHHVYSPIAASHLIAIYGGLEGDWKTWQALDERMIDCCDELWVACEMDGWRASVGVTAEIEYAKRTGKPVIYYEGDDGTDEMRDRTDGVSFEASI